MTDEEIIEVVSALKANDKTMTKIGQKEDAYLRCYKKNLIHDESIVVPQ